MYRVNITAKDGGKYWLDFKTKAEAEAHQQKLIASNHWGEPHECSIVVDDVRGKWQKFKDLFKGG